MAAERKAQRGNWLRKQTVQKQKIISAVTVVFGVDEKRLLWRDAKRLPNDIIPARQALVYLLSNFTAIKHSNISVYLGYHHRSIVPKTIEKVTQVAAIDQDYGYKIFQCINKIQAS